MKPIDGTYGPENETYAMNSSAQKFWYNVSSGSVFGGSTVFLAGATGAAVARSPSCLWLPRESSSPLLAAGALFPAM